MRTMLLGHFGSGKTEVAIAYALKLAGEGRHPLLLDLDIITPYFRSRDPAQRLADLGVEVIAPSPEWSAADLPLISGQTLMHRRAQGDRAAVLDVGGDEGARVIAALADYLRPQTYEVLAVVNAYRPATRTARQIVDFVQWVEAISRTRVAGLVNNANLGQETTTEHVLAGLDIVRAAASQLGIPVAFTAAREDLAPALRAAAIEVLPLKIFMRPPWEELP